VNYRKQVSPSLKKLLPKEDFRLYAVCTRYPAKLTKQVTPKPVTEGVYDLRWGVRDIRIIVTSQISKKKRNAMWLMFSAVRDSVGYGVSNYNGKLDEMSTAISDLLIRYETEGIIAMPYTIEDYRNEIKQRALKILTPEEVLKAFSAEERLRGLPPEEIFRAFSPEEIRAYLKKLPKKTKPRKKSNRHA